MNNTLMKFSGHKVIGSSSSEEESDSGSGSSIELDYEEIEKNRFHDLISKAEKIKSNKGKLAVSSQNLKMIQSAFILSTIDSMKIEEN